MPIKDFKTKVKNARINKGMSQRTLGLALGLSDKTISSYESGRSYPSLEILEKMADILDKPIEYFISSSKEIQINQDLENIDQLLKSITKEISDIKKILSKEE
jgi:transcriptional regulator with XRE-family HTH domain